MRIQLIEVGNSKIHAVKILREYTGFTLKECSDIVEMAPCSFNTSLSIDQFRSMQSDLSHHKAIVSPDQDFGQVSSPPPPPPSQEHNVSFTEAATEFLQEEQSPASSEQDEPAGEDVFVDFSADDWQVGSEEENEIPAPPADVPDASAFDQNVGLDLPDIPSFDLDLPIPPEVQAYGEELSSPEVSEEEELRKEWGQQAAEAAEVIPPEFSTSPPVPPAPTSEVAYEKPAAPDSTKEVELSRDEERRAQSYLRGRQRYVSAVLVGTLVTTLSIGVWLGAAAIEFEITNYLILIFAFWIARSFRVSGRAVNIGFGVIASIFFITAALVGIWLRAGVALAYGDLESGVTVAQNMSGAEVGTLFEYYVADSGFVIWLVLGIIICLWRGHERIDEKLMRKALKESAVMAANAKVSGDTTASNKRREKQVIREESRQTEEREEPRRDKIQPSSSDRELFRKKERRRKERDRERKRKREERRRRD